jgi:transaldolase
VSTSLAKPMSPIYKSVLHEMTQTTPTCLWNDSASTHELEYAIDHGAVGGTCNPVIVVEVLRREAALWQSRIEALIAQMPGATEGEVAWRLVEEMSAQASKLLLPAFERSSGRNGRMSIQTDPRFYRDPERLLAQAERFHSLAPNMIVKLPVTQAGMEVFEEATFRGISLNATVCFTLPQCMAVGEAIERGLRKRDAAGLDTRSMGPVCTIMVGRLDDWLKVVAEQQNLSVDPGYLEWAGVAVFKKTYSLYKRRNFRTRLLSAAFRNHMHWSEFIGGDVVISPPHKWQVRYNQSKIPVEHRIDTPVRPEIVDALQAQFPDFVRAFEEQGLTPDEFDSFGPTRRTLRQFIQACSDLDALIRNVMLPDPDRS